MHASPRWVVKTYFGFEAAALTGRCPSNLW